MLGVQEKQRRGDVCGDEIVVVKDVREKVGHLPERDRVSDSTMNMIDVAIGVGFNSFELRAHQLHLI